MPAPAKKPVTASAAATEPRSTDRVLTGKVITLGALLVRSASTLYRQRFDLGREEWRILALLGAQESLPLTELSLRSGLRKSQISRGVGGLMAKRLLSRVVGPEDAREARLVLTQRGRQIHTAIVDSAAQRSAMLAAGLEPAELARLHTVLDGMIVRARALIDA